MFASNCRNSPSTSTCLIMCYCVPATASLHLTGLVPLPSAPHPVHSHWGLLQPSHGTSQLRPGMAEQEKSLCALSGTYTA